MGTASPTLNRRQEILNLLRERAVPMEIAEVAAELGVHINTARFHLDNLATDGLVTRALASHQGPGRPAQVYSAVRAMNAGGPQNYQLLAEILAAGMGGDSDPRKGALEAGRRWGRHAAAASAAAKPVPLLMSVLADLEFAPEVREGIDPPVIGLRHCPFLDLAHSQPEVVCNVHLGLMRGVLESAGAPLTVKRLEPFAEPDLCAAHLATKRARPRRSNPAASRRSR